MTDIIELTSGVELTDLRVGCTQRDLFFSIKIEEPVRINIELQELTTSSRCMLLVSATQSHPKPETAVWSLCSPEPVKSLAIHPGDPNFTLGTLYIAVHYLEESGTTHARIRVALQEKFSAMWLVSSTVESVAESHPGFGDTRMVQTIKNRSLLNETSGGADESVSLSVTKKTGPVQKNSLYVGEWWGAKHHGRGVCFYAVSEGAFDALRDRQAALQAAVNEKRVQAWTAGTVTNDLVQSGMSPEEITGVSSFDHVSTWNLIYPLEPDVEVYDGYWYKGEKHGKGAYQWGDRVYVGDWERGKRSGYGELLKADGSWYKGQWFNDRKHGQGEVLLPNDIVYNGSFVNGIKEGPGQLTYPDGTIVTSNWVKDVLQSPVVARYKDGSTYNGGWDLHARNGPGALTDKDGRVHQHQWFNNQREGEGAIEYPTNVRYAGTWSKDAAIDGVYVFPNKDSYKGEFDPESNVREGQGECRYANGDVYTGSWVNDKRQGHGVLKTHKGHTYSGEWFEDEPHGRGTLEDGEGHYEGSFSRGERSGEGTQINPDGSTYTGQWCHNARAGPGVYYCAGEDVTYEGTFLQDRLVGEGTSIQNASNERYEGAWLDGKQQGHGTHVFANGDSIRGLWHRGKPQNGQVEYHSVEGGKYVGGWADGKRNGRGTQIYPDGSVYEGEWLDNVRQGQGRLTKISGESLECAWAKDAVVVGVEGKIVFPDRSVYVGQLEAGKPHGIGILTYPDNTEFRGKFENGIYQL